jgi:hypothetical protein
LASKLNFEKKLFIPLFIKTLATIVKKKKLAKKVVFPKSYKTFRKKNTKIDFFRLVSEFFFPNGLKICLPTKLDVLNLNLQKK